MKIDQNKAYKYVFTINTEEKTKGNNHLKGSFLKTAGIVDANNIKYQPDDYVKIK